MQWIWPSKLLGLGSICSFLLKNHGFLQGLGFSFPQKPAFLQVFRVKVVVKPRILQVFRVKGVVKPRILQVFRVSAPYFCSFFPFRPFFLDFQVPAGKDVPSIRFTYEIVHFPQNLPDPFLELLFRHRLASGLRPEPRSPGPAPDPAPLNTQS